MELPELRNRMVDEQLIPRGIRDPRVLAAFRRVPRHEFVPGAYTEGGYRDHPLPIGAGQTISQPYMVALMTEHLHLRGDERVLEVGTGSGYQTAILAELAKEVYSVERVVSLAENAKKRLAWLRYANYRITTGDGTLGWPEHAPYAGIIVTAGAPKVPHALIEQLTEGGRLVIPVGDRMGQVLTAITREGAGIRSEAVCGCVFVPLIGKDGWT